MLRSCRSKTEVASLLMSTIKDVTCVGAFSELAFMRAEWVNFGLALSHGFFAGVGLKLVGLNWYNQGEA